MWRSNPDNFFGYMQDAYVDLLQPGMDAASEAGVTYYDLAGDDDAGVNGDPAPEEAMRKTARWALARGDATTGLELLSKTVPRRLYGAARDSIVKSAEGEPGATWARRARADACGWCRMLATRGAVYSSAEVATMTTDHERYHDDCRCLAVAVRPGRMYMPPSYAQDWERDYQELSREVGTDPKAIAAAWDKRIEGGDRSRILVAVNDPLPTEDLIIKVDDKGKLIYDDEAYRQMSPEEKKRERARRRKLYKQQQQGGTTPAPTPAPPPTPAPSLEPPRTAFAEDIAVAMRRTNPNGQIAGTGQEWRVNCQRVVSAYELRRRGFDVTAGPNFKTMPQSSASSGGKAGESLHDDQFTDGWRFPDGSRGTWLRPAPGVDIFRDIEQSLPDGARGFVAAAWSSGRSAHVWNFEIVNGVCRWIEAQQNVTTKAEKYHGLTDKSTYRWFRTDDKEPDWDKLIQRGTYQVNGKTVT
ncbi:capsid maturation protease [Gordonia phage Hexbug]|nr:capsid maturation protease [Gordonia phage Hexbug]